jgi:hypothetical protein
MQFKVKRSCNHSPDAREEEEVFAFTEVKTDLRFIR